MPDLIARLTTRVQYHTDNNLKARLSIILLEVRGEDAADEEKYANVLSLRDLYEVRRITDDLIVAGNLLLALNTLGHVGLDKTPFDVAFVERYNSATITPEDHETLRARLVTDSALQAHFELTGI